MKLNIFINIFLISPGDIHFWIYDDVTDNSILDLQRKISICNVLATLFSLDHALFAKDHQRNM